MCSHYTLKIVQCNALTAFIESAILDDICSSTSSFPDESYGGGCDEILMTGVIEDQIHNNYRPFVASNKDQPTFASFGSKAIRLDFGASGNYMNHQQRNSPKT